MTRTTLQTFENVLSQNRASGHGPLMLASVRDRHEARIAEASGGDLIDCKDPETGALGALPAATIREIVDAVGGRVPVSATIGDEAACADGIADAVAATAGAGVDIVKVGIAPGADAIHVLSAAGSALPRGTGQGLVGVLFADLGFSPGLVDACAKAGFRGVMLDTSSKSGGNLLARAGLAKLAAFRAHAQSCGLWCGLAGGLRAGDVGVLSALRPDLLGFRGGLCPGGDRRLGLDAAAVQAVRRALNEQGSLPSRARAEPMETRA